MKAADWIEVAKLATAIIGGAWAFYLYQTYRRGQSKLQIEPAVRIHRGTGYGSGLLLLRLRITNSGPVLWRYQSGVATLFDASETEDGAPKLVEKAISSDPFKVLFDGTAFDGDTGATDPLDSGSDPEAGSIDLEPGEFMETELALAIPQGTSLMAIRAVVSGFQRRRPLSQKRDRLFGWSTFLFVDPLA